MKKFFAALSVAALLCTFTAPASAVGPMMDPDGTPVLAQAWAWFISLIDGGDYGPEADPNGTPALSTSSIGVGGTVGGGIGGGTTQSCGDPAGCGDTGAGMDPNGAP